MKSFFLTKEPTFCENYLIRIFITVLLLNSVGLILDVGRMFFEMYENCYKKHIMLKPIDK